MLSTVQHCLTQTAYEKPGSVNDLPAEYHALVFKINFINYSIICCPFGRSLRREVTGHHNAFRRLPCLVIKLGDQRDSFEEESALEL